MFGLWRCGEEVFHAWGLSRKELAGPRVTSQPARHDPKRSFEECVFRV